MTTAVQNALALWRMEGAKARLVAQRENTVWQISSRGQDYALRFHRPGYRTVEELESELDWMAELEAGGLHVPQPVALTAGGFIGVLESQNISLLSWAKGEPVGETGRLRAGLDPRAVAYAVGREMARMHDLTDAWEQPKGFSRPDWRREGLAGSDPLWGRFWEHPHLTPAQKALLMAVREKAYAQLQDMDAELDQGLIHADLLCENILLNGGQPVFLDFDDCAFGYRDFELATFLIKSMGQPYYPEMRAGLLEGYGCRRIVDSQALDFALLLRALTYPGWIIARLEESGGRERSARQVAQALELAETYMNT